jgi:hypothetical protein
MTGIHIVVDEKGRKVAVLIDLKKHGAIWEGFWDGLISESRRKEEGVPYEQYRAKRNRAIKYLASPRVATRPVTSARATS